MAACRLQAALCPVTRSSLPTHVAHGFLSAKISDRLRVPGGARGSHSERDREPRAKRWTTFGVEPETSEPSARKPGVAYYHGLTHPEPRRTPTARLPLRMSIARGEVPLPPSAAPSRCLSPAAAPAAAPMQETGAANTREAEDQEEGGTACKPTRERKRRKVAHTPSGKGRSCLAIHWCVPCLRAGPPEECWTRLS